MSVISKYSLLNKDVLINFSSDGADGAFNPDEIQRPPVRSSFWELEDDVVCSQPSRNLSRPDGLEDPEDSNASYLFCYLFSLMYLLMSYQEFHIGFLYLISLIYCYVNLELLFLFPEKYFCFL